MLQSMVHVDTSTYTSSCEGTSTGSEPTNCSAVFSKDSLDAMSCSRQKEQNLLAPSRVAIHRDGPMCMTWLCSNFTADGWLGRCRWSLRKHYCIIWAYIYIWAFLQVGTFDPGPLSMSLWDVSMQTLPTCCCQNIVSLMCLQDITYAIHTCA